MRIACVTIFLLVGSAALGQSNIANSQTSMIQACQASTLASEQANNAWQMQVQPLPGQKPWARPQSSLLTILPPTPPKPMAKMEPIPTQWPNAKFEGIPTRWPQLNVVPLGSRPGGAPGGGPGLPRRK